MLNYIGRGKREEECIRGEIRCRWNKRYREVQEVGEERQDIMREVAERSLRKG